MLDSRLDALVGSAAGLDLAITKMANGAESFIEGWYYWTPEGDVKLDPQVRGQGTNVELKCDRSDHRERNDPGCGTAAGKKMKIAGRVLCFDPEEKAGPAGLPPHYGAFIAWVGNGSCSLQFKLGLVSDARTKKAALGLPGDSYDLAIYCN